MAGLRMCGRAFLLLLLMLSLPPAEQGSPNKAQRRAGSAGGSHLHPRPLSRGGADGVGGSLASSSLPSSPSGGCSKRMAPRRMAEASPKLMMAAWDMLAKLGDGLRRSPGPASSQQREGGSEEEEEKEEEDGDVDDDVGHHDTVARGREKGGAIAEMGVDSLCGGAREEDTGVLYGGVEDGGTASGTKVEERKMRGRGRGSKRGRREITVGRAMQGAATVQVGDRPVSAASADEGKATSMMGGEGGGSSAIVGEKERNDHAGYVNGDGEGMGVEESTVQMLKRLGIDKDSDGRDDEEEANVNHAMEIEQWGKPSARGPKAGGRSDGSPDDSPRTSSISDLSNLDDAAAQARGGWWDLPNSSGGGNAANEAREECFAAGKDCGLERAEVGVEVGGGGVVAAAVSARGNESNAKKDRGGAGKTKAAKKPKKVRGVEGGGVGGRDVSGEADAAGVAAAAAAACAEDSVLKNEELGTDDDAAASKVKVKVRKKRGPKSGVGGKGGEGAVEVPTEGAEAGGVGEVPAAAVKPKKKRRSKNDPPPPPRNDHVCDVTCSAPPFAPAGWGHTTMGEANATSYVMTVEGDPVALKRPRHVMGGHTYDPNLRDKKVFLQSCKSQLPETPLEGPIGMSLVFELPRAKLHFFTPKGKWGSLRETAPKHPDKVPDLDNLVKFVLDALNEKAFADDRQICQIFARKAYRVCAGVGRTHVELVQLTP